MMMETNLLPPRTVLIVALHWEGAPFIAQLSLKKQLNYLPLEYYQKGDIGLLVTGIGKMASAVAVTRLLTLLSIRGESSLFSAAPSLPLLVNVGTCGGPTEQPVGSLFCVPQVIDAATKRRYYPDNLVHHDFAEKSLLTCDLPANEPPKSATHPRAESPLVDMEGSGFFEAARAFVAPERIAIFKVVSDHYTSGCLSPEKVTSLIAAHVPPILSFAYSANALLRRDHQRLPKELALQLEDLCQSARLTSAQLVTLTQAVTAALVRAKGSTQSLQSIVSEFNSRAREVSHSKERTEFLGQLIQALNHCAHPFPAEEPSI